MVLKVCGKHLKVFPERHCGQISVGTAKTEKTKIRNATEEHAEGDLT